MLVLVVDDEVSLRDYAGRILEDEGYEVIFAGDGVEALGLLRANASPVRLIVTDVWMPRMTGPELADHLGSWPEAPPVLFVSGSSAELVLPGPLLAKPFLPQDLMRMVRNVLAAARPGAMLVPRYEHSHI